MEQNLLALSAEALPAIPDEDIKAQTILKSIVNKAEIYIVTFISTDAKGNEITHELLMGKDRTVDEKGDFIGEKALIQLVFDDNKQAISDTLQEFKSEFIGQTLLTILS